MRHNKKFKFAALTATIALMSATGMAWAASSFNEDEAVTITIEAPTPTLGLTAMSFGAKYYAVNHASTTASVAVSTAGALTHTVGTAGNARLVPIDTTGKAALAFTATGGAPSTLMSLKIGDTGGAATVTLTGATTPTDATFTLGTWTAVASKGVLTTPLNATTGVGSVTLDSSGEAAIDFGATLKTVPDAAKQYGDQDYTGTIRVTLAY